MPSGIKLVLFCNTSEEFKNMIAQLYGKSLKVGLEMNIDKTKIMTTDNQDGYHGGRYNCASRHICEPRSGNPRGQGYNQCNEFDRRIRRA